MDDLITIRNMRPDDYGIIESLKQLNEQFIPEYELEDYFVDRVKSNIITLVALLDNKIIGTASMIIERKIIHRGNYVGHIEDVAILPEYQKLGIGKRMIAFLVNMADSYDCYKVILNCSPNNVKFYENCGFKKNDEVCMRINLS